MNRSQPSIYITSVLLCVYLGSVDAHAQSTVTGIQVNRQNETLAPGVEVTAPRQKTIPIDVKMGHRFESGTIVKTPANTILQIKSVHSGNVQVISPGSKIQLSAGAKGDSFKLWMGKIWSSVSNRLNFYNVRDSGDKIQGAVRGTVFSMEVGGNGVKFETSEGQVALHRKIPVKVANATTNERSRSLDLTTTRTDYISPERSIKSYSLEEYINEVEVYDTYDQAQKHFEQQLQNNGQAGNRAAVAQDYTTLGYLYLDNDIPEQALSYFIEALQINLELYPWGIDPVLADDYTALGYSYMDMSKPDQAATYFEKALAINLEVDPDGWHIADSYIDLGEALIDSGRNANAHLKAAIEILNFIVEIDTEDFNDEQDSEMERLIAMDLINDYQSLGWAWQLLGDADTADGYFESADQLINNYE